MLKLREYQEIASDFVYANDKSLILAKVGAGKTAIAITAMKDMLTDGIVRRWLVVAPKRVAQHTWPDEIPKWSKMSFNVAVGSASERIAAITRMSDVVVINYDTLQWLADQKVVDQFDGIVFDELTRMKGAAALTKQGKLPKHGKRFAVFFEAIKNINIRIGLTGSFTSNGLEDCYGQVRIVDPLRLGRSKGAFLQQYFWSANPKLGEWIPRPGALNLIMERIRPITYLLESKEYEDTLPPLSIIEQRFDLTDRKPYEKMKKDMLLEFGQTQITAINAGVVLQKLRQLSAGFVYETVTVPIATTPGKFITTKTPHWFGADKFDTLDDLLTENHHENTLVFYQYQEELAELRRRYPHAQTLDDHDAVNRWNAGRIQVLLAHPDSAQYGLNLQHGGCAIVFVSLPWSLTNFEQAIGRLHRSGQKHEVRVYCLIANKTVDEQVLAALRDKKTLAEIAVEALK